MSRNPTTWSNDDYRRQLSFCVFQRDIPDLLAKEPALAGTLEIVKSSKEKSNDAALNELLEKDSSLEAQLGYLYECLPDCLSRLALAASKASVPDDLLPTASSLGKEYRGAHEDVSKSFNVSRLRKLLETECRLQQQLTWRLRFFTSYLQSLAALAVEGAAPEALLLDAECYAESQKKCREQQRLKPMEDYLLDKPELQERLAFHFNYVPSKWLLSQELPAVVDRRRLQGKPVAAYKPEDNPYEWACENRLQGLCFSGGGIRSATFNLGILQGLAGLGKLSNFDYLSSVSGGGYIHEWFAAWVKHEDSKKPGGGLNQVTRLLSPLPCGEDAPFQPEPIRWLRRYSNYLTPQKGFFTADTWVVVAIWLRNTLLNQVVLASALFFLVLLPHFVNLWLQSIALSHLSLTIALVCFVLASAAVAFALHAEYERVRHCDMYGSPGKQGRRRFGGESTVKWLVVLPLLVASLALLEGDLAEPPPPYVLFSCLALLAAMGSAIAFAGGVVRTYKINHGLIDKAERQESVAVRTKDYFDHFKERWLRSLRTFGGAYLGSAIMTSIVAAAAGGLLIIAIDWLLGVRGFPLNQLSGLPASPCSIRAIDCGTLRRLQLTFGPPLFLFVPFFTIVIGAGLVGRNYPDWLREWLARVRAWSLLFGLGWMAYFAIALLSAPLIELLRGTSQDHHWISSIKWPAVIAWIATTIGSVLAGKSPKANGEPKDSSPWLNLLAVIGPYVFILGLLMLLAHVADLAYTAAAGNLLLEYALFFLPIAIWALFAWRVDINDFSMNAFYRNRLTRCYLGATNLHRDPSPVTGFDDRDTRGMQISRLQPKYGFSGPLPIICTTLNLTFGEDLAWQERKAASFAFSPLYSGYTVGWTSGKAGKEMNFNGFVPTASYYEPDGGINIAQAVAISGAAASPNDGYHTNPATAFLMTVFNVRLGWWILNPRRSKLAGRLADARPEKPEWPSPRFGFVNLVKELLGKADDQSPFVYLSDGGHFENMGLYELVRRRCYNIVLCDAEADEQYKFDGFANAIRKCRIDFGVEIKMDDMINVRPKAKTGNCKAHFAIGTIRYPETKYYAGVPQNYQPYVGTILYIKSSLTSPDSLEDPPGPDPLAAESLDILNYKLEHASFPHDTTANQWFTESQFESYRRLGQHIVEEVRECGSWKPF